jgi:uncharacterized protein (TIGR02147 family)
MVYDYGAPALFLSDLLKYRKMQGSFSLRQRVAKVGGCSQPLVSQILNGKRQLNRDNLLIVAQVLQLTRAEQEHLDQQLSARQQDLRASEKNPPRANHRPQNHLLSDWLNPYVKDLIHLKGFRFDAETLFSMLRGLAPPHRLLKSVRFLQNEGFWRVTERGDVVPERAAVTTSNGIPNEKIRRFHKKALEIARAGLETLTPAERKASTVLLSVDDEKLDELKSLIDAFQNRLLEFIEDNPSGKDALVQVIVHMTPVGRGK